MLGVAEGAAAAVNVAVAAVAVAVASAGAEANRSVVRLPSASSPSQPAQVTGRGGMEGGR